MTILRTSNSLYPGSVLPYGIWWILKVFFALETKQSALISDGINDAVLLDKRNRTFVGFLNPVTGKTTKDWITANLVNLLLATLALDIKFGVHKFSLAVVLSFKALCEINTLNKDFTTLAKMFKGSTHGALFNFMNIAVEQLNVEKNNKVSRPSPCYLRQCIAD